MSNGGSYAVVTRDDSYRSIVYYYNGNFKLINEIKKDKYVTALAFNENGEKLAIASAYDADGDYECEIQVIKGNSDKAEFTIVESSLIPISAKWLADGNLCVLYSDCAVIYSQKGERVSYINSASLQSLRFALGDELLVSVYNSTVLGYDKTVDIYDKNADIIYTEAFKGDVISVKIVYNKVCLLFEDRVMLIDPHKRSVLQAEVDPNAKDVVFYENEVIVCYSGGAFPAIFEREPSS